MPQLELAGKTLEVNEDGFMQETDRWNEDIARAFAAREGVTELMEDHWKVMRYARAYYLQHGICPMIRKVRMETGLNLAALYALFPQGRPGSACRWAGLPRSTGCS